LFFLHVRIQEVGSLNTTKDASPEANRAGTLISDFLLVELYIFIVYKSFSLWSFVIATRVKTIQIDKQTRWMVRWDLFNSNSIILYETDQRVFKNTVRCLGLTGMD
jgi:hypothetical protein